MRADVKLGGSTIFVVISQADEGWPFIMENDSGQDFTFHQTVRTSRTTYTSQKNLSFRRTWTIPTALRVGPLVLGIPYARSNVDITPGTSLQPKRNEYCYVQNIHAEPSISWRSAT